VGGAWRLPAGVWRACAGRTGGQGWRARLHAQVAERAHALAVGQADRLHAALRPVLQDAEHAPCRAAQPALHEARAGAHPARTAPARPPNWRTRALGAPRIPSLLPIRVSLHAIQVHSTAWRKCCLTRSFFITSGCGVLHVCKDISAVLCANRCSGGMQTVMLTRRPSSAAKPKSSPGVTIGAAGRAHPGRGC